MINIIICDDNKFFLMELSNLIDNFFDAKNINYKIYLFTDYNQDFFNIMNSNIDNKIYILDIETPSANGIDIGRKIRNNDLNSFIIYISSYAKKYVNKIINSDTMFMGYISKEKKYADDILKVFRKILKCGFTNQVIRFKDQGIIYTFDMRNIIYIFSASNKRRSIIHTINGDFPVRMTLKNIYELLDYRFEYSHRSCIINRENVFYIDTVVKIIKFKNGDTSNLISDSFIRKNNQHKRIDKSF